MNGAAHERPFWDKIVSDQQRWEARAILRDHHACSGGGCNTGADLRGLDGFDAVGGARRWLEAEGVARDTALALERRALAFEVAEEIEQHAMACAIGSDADRRSPWGERDLGLGGRRRAGDGVIDPEVEPGAPDGGRPWDPGGWRPSGPAEPWDPRGLPTGLCSGFIGMRRPPFLGTRLKTQDCFRQQYGPIDDWPAEGCCPPINGPRDCTVPSTSAFDLTFRRGRSVTAEVEEWFLASGLELITVADLERIVRAEAVIEAAIALLRENIDIVRWVSCLAETYGDMTDRGLAPRLEALVVGDAPMHVSLIRKFQKWATLRGKGGEPKESRWKREDAGAAAAAFTYFYNPAPDGSVGVIVPIEHVWWCCWANHFATGSSHAFCAVVAASGNLLHEIAHICVDGLERGGHHDPSEEDQDLNKAEACMDEVRMLESAYYWAMAQRYPCLGGSSCCASMADPQFFLNSWKLGPWSCAPCISVGCP